MKQVDFLRNELKRNSNSKRAVNEKRCLKGEKTMIPVPYQKLLLFKEKLGLGEKEFEALDPFRDTFIKRKDDFPVIFMISSLKSLRQACF